MIRVVMLLYLSSLLSDYYLKAYSTHTLQVTVRKIAGQSLRNLAPIAFLTILMDVFTWNLLYIALILSVLYLMGDLLIGVIEDRRANPPSLLAKMFKHRSYIFLLEQSIKLSSIFLVYYIFEPYSIRRLLMKFREFLVGSPIIYDQEVKLLGVAVVLAVMMRVCAHLVSLIVNDLSSSYENKVFELAAEDSPGDFIQEAAATTEHHPMMVRFMNPAAREDTRHVEIAESLEIREKDPLNNQFDNVHKASKVHHNFTSDPKSVGKYIGMIERVLIVFFVLNAAYAAIAFIGAVKTLARFKQFDDRSFAEYYLLGTLLSVFFGFAGGFLLNRII